MRVKSQPGVGNRGKAQAKTSKNSARSKIAKSTPKVSGARSTKSNKKPVAAKVPKKAPARAAAKAPKKAALKKTTTPKAKAPGIQRGGRKRAVPAAPATAATSPPPSKRAKKQAATTAPAAAPVVQKSPLQRAVSALRKTTQKKIHKVDGPAVSHVPTGSKVLEDYDCMLNQTNIGQNNNKFYVIQVIEAPNGNYYTWTRWGRVGEEGQNAMFGPFGSADPAVKQFEQKFKDKTRNNWAQRDNFVPSAGKYTLIEVGEFQDASGSSASAAVVSTGPKFSAPPKVLPSKLDPTTRLLMDLIFNEDTFKTAMADLKLDVKKMPLGQLSKQQIARGFDCLDELDKAINDGASPSKLDELSSKFYTLIPHSFGRVRPPTIRTANEIREKKDMLIVLADIEVAQALQKQQSGVVPNARNEVPDPLDAKYALLDCDLELVNKSTDEFKLIDGYTRATQGRKVSIVNVWKVNRRKEAVHFTRHSAVKNRKLLWHGTNIAVIVAILQGGLRIMPHSGGRLGKGLYFASENGKSAGYVRCKGHTGIMFLNEVVLGNEWSQPQDDCRLVKPPSGYNSIVGRGHTEPDPKVDTTLSFDGYQVVVPQGKPQPQSQWQSSSFSQSEYLIYDETQVRIRYLILANFDV